MLYAGDEEHLLASSFDSVFSLKQICEKSLYFCRIGTQVREAGTNKESELHPYFFGGGGKRYTVPQT